MGPLKGCSVELYVAEVWPVLDAGSCSGVSIAVPWSRGGGTQHQGRSRAAPGSGSILLSMQKCHFRRGGLQVSCEGICGLRALAFSLERG